MVNAEQKIADTANAPVVSNAGAVTLLSGVAQGDGDFQRNGNQIKAHSSYFRGLLAINGTATRTFCRVMIFFDKESRGAAPGVTDVLQVASVESPLNIENAGWRFVIIHDKTYALSINGPETKTTVLFKDFGLKHHIRYLSAGGAAADQGTNAIWLLLISNEVTNTPTVTYYHRLRFYDN